MSSTNRPTQHLPYKLNHARGISDRLRDHSEQQAHEQTERAVNWDPRPEPNLAARNKKGIGPNRPNADPHPEPHEQTERAVNWDPRPEPNLADLAARNKKKNWPQGRRRSPLGESNTRLIDRCCYVANASATAGRRELEKGH